MSERNDLVDAIKDDNVKKLKELTKNMKGIDSANIKITIHDPSNNNNQNRNDNQPNLIPEDGLTLLHVAAYYDALDCFRYLQLSRQISLRKKSSHSFLPLHYSCWSGASEVSLYILTCDPSQASLAIEGGNDIQLLYCSLIGGDSELLQELFNKGASLSQSHNNQDKLIKKAIGLHRADILRILFKDYKPQRTGAKIDSPPIIKAIIDHNALAFEILYNGKEDLTAKIPDMANANIISLICENDRDHNFKKVLLEKVIPDARDLNLEPTSNNTPGICSWACSYLDVDVARQLFKLPNVNLNRLDSSNRTAPSKLAVRNDKNAQTVEMLEFLIDSGFKINDTHGGKTPTLLESFLLAITKNVDAIRLLVNKGANVDAPFIAQKNNRFKSLYEFIEKSKDPKLVPLKELFKKAHDANQE